MRLVSCHVENFGKISDFSYNFAPGVNNIMHDNGWGKSTLAAFIRVMFFGFDREGKRGELQNERKRYTPWQSGTYGGEIVFEQSGKKYKIKRVFSTKKTEEDTFSVSEIESNSSADFSENIGEEIFGIDAESFEKTIFVAQQDCETDITDSIHSKIGDVEGQTAGLGNFKAVMKNIKKAQDLLNPSKKDSETAKLEETLSGLEEKLGKKDGLLKKEKKLSENLKNLEKDRGECKLKQKEIQDRLAELSRLNDLRVVNEKYKSLINSENKAKERWNKIASDFPGKAPTQSEIDENMNRADKLRALELNISSSGLNEEQAERFEKLKKEFTAGVPDDEDLDIASSLIRNIEAQKSKADAARLSSSEISELEGYRKKFSAGLPTADEINSLIEEWKKRLSLKTELATVKDRAAVLKSSPLPENYARANASKLPRKMLVTGIIFLLIAFIASLLHAPVAVGICIALIGAGLVLLSFALGRKDEKYEANRKSLAENERRQELEETLSELCNKENAIREIDKTVGDFLTELNGHFDKNTVNEDLYNLLTDLELFEKLKNREDNFNAERELVEKDDSERKIAAFFRQYMKLKDNDYSSMLQQLRFDKKEYLQLKDISEQRVSNAELYKEEWHKLAQFLKDVGVEEGDDLSQQINQMRDSFRELQKANMDYNSARTDRQIFESGNDIESLKEVDNVRFDESGMEKLSRQFDELEEKKDKLEKDIRSTEAEISECSDMLKDIAAAEEDYSASKARLDELNHKYDILLKTEAYLKKARDSFAEKYMSPIRLAYDKYYSLLSDDEKEYELDSNLNITFREYGKNRETGFLSEGYKDLVGLCRRMAMIEAMYGDEKPFVILDDPFVNLDDARIEGAKAFLNSIGENFQIIYFTCNQYRVA